jgi:hypothetical protein
MRVAGAVAQRLRVAMGSGEGGSWHVNRTTRQEGATRTIEPATQPTERRGEIMTTMRAGVFRGQGKGSIREAHDLFAHQRGGALEIAIRP